MSLAAPEEETCPEPTRAWGTSAQGAEMAKLSIEHRTSYSYRCPVQLTPYRLLLRPREGPDLLLRHHQITVSPEGKVAWTTDVFGNAIATLTFSEPTYQFEIISHAD